MVTHMHLVDIDPGLLLLPSELFSVESPLPGEVASMMIV